MSQNAPRPSPPVEIILDKPRNLRCTMRALRMAEDRLSQIYGRRTSIFEVFEKGGKISATDLTVTLWSLLVSEDSCLTEDQVGDMLDIGNMNYVGEKLSELFGSSDGGPKAAQGEQRPLEHSRGLSSGPSLE